MSALDPPHGLADATNSNGRSAANTRPAGYPTGGWLVKVDTTHFGTSHGSDIGCVRTLFQARFRLGRVRSSTRRA
jgi:hypothetical protein